MDNLCSQCAFLIYDEDAEEYICDARMDEDDFSRLSQNSGVVPSALPKKMAISVLIARRPWTMSEIADWGLWMAFARRYWEMPIGIRNSSRRISPGVDM